MNDFDLKPCPFCGSTDIHITESWPHYPYCLGCGAAVRHGMYKTGEEAIVYAAKKWNTRVQDEGDKKAGTRAAGGKEKYGETD